MLSNFEGIQYRLADNWYPAIKLDDFKNKPIHYLEIGTFYGANLLSVVNSYGLHAGSKLYCIDPWEDYTAYTGFNGQYPEIYKTFLSNVDKSGVKEKIIVKRGCSDVEIPKLHDDFFDIIYIDGNHNPESVLEDAVLSFRKLKVGGYMIFDDYRWGGPDLTQRGIDGFLHGYHKRINVLGEHSDQVFLIKLS